MAAKIWFPSGMILGLVLGVAATILMLPDATPPTSASALVAQTGDHGSSPLTQEPAGRTGPRPPGLPQFQVRFEDNLLTVKANEAPLDNLMKEISRQAHIAVEFGEGVAGHKVSADFSDQPLYAGLRHLLAGHDFFTYHRGERGLLTVWIYGNLEGRGLFPIPFETWASTADLQQQLDDLDSNERMAALEALVERGGGLAEAEVEEALDDGDERIRTAALYHALNEGMELPTERLLDLALADSSHNVRFLALKNLTGKPAEEQAAAAALDDPNPVIRNYAESVFLRLYPLGDSPELMQQTPNSNQQSEKRR